MTMSISVATALTTALLAAFPAALAAQAMNADEEAIRALIAAEEAGKRPPHTADSIFWSGAYRRPIVGGQDKPEQISDLATRTGERTKTTVRRIDVSQSGDLAYEFSDIELTLLPQERTFPTSLLRAWKKVNGLWHAVAHFQRPHVE